MANGAIQRLKAKAYIVFPILTVVIGAVILVSPMIGGPVAFLHGNAFARFCLFWCLGVCAVLGALGKRLRPSLVAVVSTAAAILVSVAFFFVYGAYEGTPSDVAAFYFSCLSGAILGTLAGTWLIYVFEVYLGGR